MNVTDAIPDPDDDEVRTFFGGDNYFHEDDNGGLPAEAETVCVNSIVVELGGPDDPGDRTYRPLPPHLLEQLRRQRPLPSPTS